MIGEGTEILEETTVQEETEVKEVAEQDVQQDNEEVNKEEPEWNEPQDETQDPRGREVFRGIYESDILPHADFKLKCSCGYEKTIAEDTTGAVQYLIPATGKHNLDVGCEGCGTVISLYFTEYTPKVEIEETIEEVKQTENEQVLQENEITK